MNFEHSFSCFVFLRLVYLNSQQVPRALIQYAFAQYMSAWMCSYKCVQIFIHVSGSMYMPRFSIGWHVRACVSSI